MKAVLLILALLLIGLLVFGCIEKGVTAEKNTSAVTQPNDAGSVVNDDVQKPEDASQETAPEIENASIKTNENVSNTPLLPVAGNETNFSNAAPSSTVEKTEQNLTAIALALNTGVPLALNTSLPIDVNSNSTRNVNSLLDRIKAEVLPGANDAVRPYEWKNKTVTLDGNGFSLLLEMNSKIKLGNENLTARFNALAGNSTGGKPIIDHLCCTAPIGGCECGHAQAQKGLLKFLLQAGLGDAEILEEELLWNKMFFPNYYVQKAIDEKAANGEISKAFSSELKSTLGGC
ncbi:MAG: hypothetical protein Q7T16_06045 [Candidatus Burarchaeum sp.]|nr:hypothetical protein [Candidatus Burarchaeum sp.]MDO8340189.1 hypothetical protein [Candidatus Burarchaeum sp.]